MNLPLENEDDELELSLELSVGGNYGKPNKIEEKGRDPFEGNGFNDYGISRSDVSCDKNDVGVEIGGGFLDLTNKRKIQALRRQEARKKREDKLLKSRNVNASGFLEDKLFLEAQKFQSRVEDREIREKERVFARKREKSETNEGGIDLSLSLFKEDKEMHVKCLFPNANGIAYLNGFENENLSMGCDSGLSNGKNEQKNRASMSNISTERSSSVVSGNLGKSQKGESTSDAGSHSSDLISCLDRQTPATDMVEQLEGNNSSSPIEQRLSRRAHSNQSKSENPSSPTQSKETSNNIKCQNQAAAPHMPCVSATGNGPNGRTITGFLYKYTKSEVSIMCVCHGVSFSPAEFVEHAGCVDIENPLRHITVVPSL